MKKLIIIKYGELSTKKKNIKFFITTLKENIESTLKGLDYNIKYDFGRMFIYSNELETVLEKLKYVFGIHEIMLGYELDTNDIDSIKENVLNLLKNKTFKTFKVITKRQNKKYPIKSMEISNILGGTILKGIKDIKVDVKNPELKVYIEIRNETSYIYFDAHSGIKGYPVGVQGKALLMLSGGIDSPVAGYLAMKRGIRIEAVYFDSPPYTSRDALEKVKTLSKILSRYSGYIKLHVVPFTEIQNQIRGNIPAEYLVTIMRRMMYRITERLMKSINGKVIVNGESIGQVASQTLTSMVVINDVVSTPVIRPVACLDKLEIIDIAKKIDTYETSILPYEDCCTIFVPTHPVINPSIEKATLYENRFDYESLIKDAIKNTKIIKLSPNDKGEFDELI